MELVFTEQGGVYVTEFEVSADFNLHIERNQVGYIRMYQRGSGNGRYDIVKDAKFSDKDMVLDYETQVLVSAKHIKIVSEVLPTYAVLTTNGEVTEIKSQSKEVEIVSNGTTNITPDAGYSYLSGVSVKVNVPQSGGSASGNDYQYIDLSKVEGSKSSLVGLSIMAKLDTGDGYMLAPSGALLEFENMTNAINATKAIAISPSMKFISFGEESTVEQAIQMMGIDLSPALVTEEEFYNLNA